MVYAGKVYRGNLSRLMKRTRHGFTLVEIMIVVAIIAIIAAIALPQLLRQRITANETAAVGALRTLVDAEMAFKAGNCLDSDSDGTPEYGTLAQLSSPPNGGPGFISADLADGQRNGYTYTVTFTGTGGANQHFQIVAMPTTAGVTGVRSFYVDETGTIRYNRTGGTPNASSPALEE